jgi:hypothetical protein
MEKDAEQIGVIIFGKAHYVGLVEEIRKQFREKVNIYVAI